MITPADKAVLRLAVGLGLAVLVAYGFALQMPHVVCLMAMIVLCKPGPPIPPVKAAALALLLAGLLVTGVLMVPLLENYALAAVMLSRYSSITRGITLPTASVVMANVKNMRQVSRRASAALP